MTEWLNVFLTWRNFFKLCSSQATLAVTDWGHEERDAVNGHHIYKLPELEETIAQLPEFLLNWVLFLADQTIDSRLWYAWKSAFHAWDMVIWKGMLKICESLFMGTSCPAAQMTKSQIWSKVMNNTIWSKIVALFADFYTILYFSGFHRFHFHYELFLWLFPSLLDDLSWRTILKCWPAVEENKNLNVLTPHLASET